MTFFEYLLVYSGHHDNIPQISGVDYSCWLHGHLMNLLPD